MKLFEKQFTEPVMLAIAKQIKAGVSEVRKDMLTARDRVDEVLLNTDMADALKDIYTTVGVYAANKTLREITASTKGFGFNEEFIRLILTYFQQYLLNKAVIPVTNTVKHFILKFIDEGTREGWGAEKIAQKINEESKHFLIWETRRIVRTESAKAHNYGQEIAEEKSEWQSVSEWIAADDHRTRHSHNQMDGVKVDYGEKFAVPVHNKDGVQIGVDMMTGPGDPTASAYNVINCRCTKSKRAKRDKDGRLIPKIEKMEV